MTTIKKYNKGIQSIARAPVLRSSVRRIPPKKKIISFPGKPLALRDK